MKKKPRRASIPPVSLGGIVREELPLPYVHYPSHYGTFFAFSEDEAGPPFLCECSKTAIHNYIELRKEAVDESDDYQYDVGNHFDQLHLPEAVAQAVRHQVEPWEMLEFKKAICHRCNLSPPTRRFCHEMYGVRFMQYYGWYVEQAFLRFGILRRRWSYLGGITPEEYVKDIDAIREATTEVGRALEWFQDTERLAGLQSQDPAIAYTDDYFREVARRQGILRRAQRNARRAERVLSRKVENIVREEFGHKKVGDGWTSETLLYQLVSRLLPTYRILRHHRPAWLDGLELDIFVPDLRLGIEYQGQQHYYAVEAWGGDAALKELQERDARKVRTCKENGMELIAIDYTEPLTLEYIKHRIGESISDELDK